mmetsp:Transcript_5550/g.8536  ORF Transcript_5550/g.8536 Transcript_5550/m.8536 type:complete len:309 (+) Transcript_5550:36-962(+)
MDMFCFNFSTWTPCKIRCKGYLFFCILCQSFSVSGSIFCSRRSRILWSTRTSPFEFENQVIVSITLQFLHGPCCIFSVHKRNKSKSSRYKSFLILGQIHTRYSSKWLKQILQIRFGGVFGNIGDTNRVEVVLAPLRHFSARGCFPCRGRNVSSTRSVRIRRRLYLCPSWFFFAREIVLSLQLTTFLFLPKHIEILAERVGSILVLQIRVGIRILQHNIVLGLDRHVRLILVQCSLTKRFPLAAFFHVDGFSHSCRRHPHLANGFQQLIRPRGMRAVTRNYLDSLAVDAGFLGRRNPHAALCHGSKAGG